MAEKCLKRKDARTVSTTLSYAEIELYDQARAELGLTIGQLVRVALKYLLWTYKTVKSGGKLSLTTPDGEVKEIIILELEGATLERGSG